jgi:hypothetical protein
MQRRILDELRVLNSKVHEESILQNTESEVTPKSVKRPIIAVEEDKVFIPTILVDNEASMSRKGVTASTSGKDLAAMAADLGKMEKEN